MRGNSPQTYGSIAKSFHWLVALLIFTLIPLGVIANGMADADPMKPTLFSLHKTLGLLLFFLALARILWALAQPKPAPLHPERKAEAFAAATVHWLLYASLIIIPLSGWVTHAASAGFAQICWPFGQNLPFVPKSESLVHIAASLHIIFERVLVAAILLHIAGALKHHFIDRDDTLRRMLPGQTAPEVKDAGHGSALPFAAALGVYVIALGIGAGLGMFKSDAIAAAPELAEVETQWQVQEGQIALTVTQLGSPVEGSFADWTAAINFNETPDDTGRYGDVEVQISIPSLTLGSVTQQALGADFFNATEFQIASFRADILRDGEGYLADGVLTIRGAEAPVGLPFTLEIEGDTARMEGSTIVNRANFQIGAGTQPTESNLAFDVKVDVSLTATR